MKLCSKNVLSKGKQSPIQSLVQNFKYKLMRLTPMCIQIFFPILIEGVYVLKNFFVFYSTVMCFVLSLALSTAFKIDGICVGFRLYSISGVRFTNQITSSGTFNLKFAEPNVDGGGDQDDFEDLQLMKENATKQWDSLIGTVEAGTSTALGGSTFSPLSGKHHSVTICFV